jgi:hypothetical protein
MQIISKKYFFSFFFLITAIYHFIGIFYKINDSSALRHSLFVLINLFCIFGFFKRPKYFAVFLTFLLIQQFYSHGGDIIGYYRQVHKIDWISIADILFLVFVLRYYIIDLNKT